MRKQCMMGLAQNDGIEELSIQHIPRKMITKDLNQDKRMRELGFGDILYEVSDQNINTHYELGRIFCMRNIKIVNIDLGFKGYLSVIYHAIFSKHIQQPSRVQLIRIINFSRKGNEMGVFNSEFYELLISKRLQTPITIMLGPEGVKDLSLIVK